jgi:hypothetical protein
MRSREAIEPCPAADRDVWPRILSAVSRCYVAGIASSKMIRKAVQSKFTHAPLKDQSQTTEE